MHRPSKSAKVAHGTRNGGDLNVEFFRVDELIDLVD